MSFDYDRLRELVDEHTPGPWELVGEYADGEPRPDTSRMLRGAGGEYLGIMHHPDAELAALAPTLARELLRLRDGVEQQITHLEALLAAAESRGHHGFARPIQARVAELTGLLEGDNK